MYEYGCMALVHIPIIIATVLRNTHSHTDTHQMKKQSHIARVHVCVIRVVRAFYAVVVYRKIHYECAASWLLAL